MRKPKKHTIWSRARRAGRRLRKILREVDVSLGGISMKFATDFMEEPLETRRGINPEDRSPFYESDENTLKKYYRGYDKSTPFLNDMLYADLIPFEIEGLKAVDSAAVKVSSVKVILEDRDYVVPKFLKKHQAAALDIMKKQGRLVWDDENNGWENDRTARLTANPKDGVFNCQPARYFDQVGTNLTVDWASGLLPENALTIRADIERSREGKLLPLAESRLANTFGTAIFFFSSDLKRELVRERNTGKVVAIPDGGFHCTVSGVLMLDDDRQPGQHNFDFFMDGTHREIKRETGLDHDSGDYLIFPLAFARELPRAGKPQLFFMAISLVDDETLRQKCLQAPERHEFKGFQYDHSGRFPAVEEHERDHHKNYTYEGWAAWLLSNEFIELNEYALLKLVNDHKVSRSTRR